MLDSKKNKLKNLNDENVELVNGDAFKMPEDLANLSTGLDLFKLDLDKLVSAPDEWNFYSKLSDSKMDELVESIASIGLMHPIVVWEQPDGKYMILSGHNRKQAYEILYERTKDEKYKKIHCYVKKHNELDEETAKEIIIDTNWVQRQLSSMERARSIYEKYTSVSRNKNFNKAKGKDGHTRDIIAEQYNISGRQVSNYYKLNYLINEFQLMLADNRLSIRMGVKLADFLPEIQKLIYTSHLEVLDVRLLNEIGVTMSKDEVGDFILKYVEGLKTNRVNLNYNLRVEGNVKDGFEADFEQLCLKYNIEIL